MSTNPLSAGDMVSLAASTSTTSGLKAAAEVQHEVNGPIPDLESTDASAAMQTQQKYNEERTKRLRPDGVSQYADLRTSPKFKHYQDDPWVDPHTPNVGAPALVNGSRCKVLILGAGFGGLLFAVRLIQAGINVDDIRIVDSAGGFGGTWYWNRYPGLMCDVESYIYMPLLEEMGYMPKHKYAYGPELREYAEIIAEKWNLKGKTTFKLEVKNLAWDDNGKEWVVKLARKRTGSENPAITVRSNSVIFASGLLNNPHLPRLPGIEKFRGHSFHTSRWDYAYTGGSPTDPSLTKLRELRVGIIGTGATAVQAVPHLAKWAKELYVFQRTPSSVGRRDNRGTDAEWWTSEVQSKKGWQRERMENFNAHLSNVSPPPPINMVADEWAKMPSFSAIIGGPTKVSLDSIPAHVASLHALDLPRQEKIRARIEEIVNDKTTAAKLKPWYPSWCKRPCFHDDYLPTFNLPNVTLVDTGGKGVEFVTERGVIVGDSEYEMDLLIFSTGFRSPAVGSPASKADVSVVGRDSQSLDVKWAEAVSTLHGVMSRGFPNLFWPGPLQAGAAANQTFVLDQLSTHVAYILSNAAQMAAPGQTFTIEPTAQAEEDWSMRIMSGAASFAAVANCTPGYINKEGEVDRNSGKEEQMKAARGAIWGHGIADYVRVIEAWRDEGRLQGLEVTVKD
jgi:cation diffusion facilitator CzcD-associated flavoprotein CzcO